ncbi:MAG: hypothetical protein JSU04_05840 [Bdellovibrionales bacterium]|nr:hypothetical protein [Bdellovibrionales bacterium]
MKYFTVLLTLFFVNLASAATKSKETSLLVGRVNEAISITSHMDHLRAYPDPVWQVEVKAQVNQQVTVLKSAEFDSLAEAEELQTRLQEIVLMHFNYLPVKLTKTETEISVYCTIITTTAIEAEVRDLPDTQPAIILNGKNSTSHYDERCADF